MPVFQTNSKVSRNFSESAHLSSLHQIFIYIFNYQPSGVFGLCFFFLEIRVRYTQEDGAISNDKERSFI